tara:strand:+ start:2767 stop:3003 length:237 start_codon:yes stop_codon:yes gene_type:complete
MRKQNSKGDWFKIERVGAGAVVSILNKKTAGYMRRGMLERWRIVFPKADMSGDEVKHITTHGMKIEDAVELFVKRIEQ